MNHFTLIPALNIIRKTYYHYQQVYKIYKSLQENHYNLIMIFRFGVTIDKNRETQYSFKVLQQLDERTTHTKTTADKKKQHLLS